MVSAGGSTPNQNPATVAVTNPPNPGDGALAHPEGGGIISWHPHSGEGGIWAQFSKLVRDGMGYTVMRYNIWSNGGEYQPGTMKGNSSYEAIDDNGGKTAATDGETEELMASPPPPSKKKPSRRKSEGDAGEGKKKSKRGKKGKPRPSLPAVSRDDDGGLE